jgi:hypothetical protein
MWGLNRIPRFRVSHLPAEISRRHRTQPNRGTFTCSSFSSLDALPYDPHNPTAPNCKSISRVRDDATDRSLPSRGSACFLSQFPLLDAQLADAPIGPCRALHIVVKCPGLALPLLADALLDRNVTIHNNNTNNNNDNNNVDAYAALASELVAFGAVYHKPASSPSTMRPRRMVSGQTHIDANPGDYFRVHTAPR